MPPKTPKNVEDKAEQSRHEVAYEKRCIRTGGLLDDASMHRLPGGLQVVRLSIRFPTEDRGDCLASLVVDDQDGARWVGFSASRYGLEVVYNLMKAAHDDEVRWKEDRYGASKSD